MSESILRSRYGTAIILACIILFALALRASFLIRGKFLTLGTMAAVLTMKQAISNGYVIHTNPLAGFPNHPYIFPEEGLVYFAVYMYEILPSLGIFGDMYLIKILFTVLAAITVYLFAKKITGRSESGILSSLLYATSEIGMTAEAFNRWKGDSFVPILLLFSVLMLVYLIEIKDTKVKIKKLGIIAGIILPIVFSVYVWIGGLYAAAAFFFVAISLLISYLVPSLKKQLSIMLILVVLAWLLFLSGSFNFAVGLGKVEMTTGIFQSDVLQIAGQLESAYYLPAPFYNTAMYYVWILAGFLSSIALVLATLFKYPFAKKERSQKNAYISMFALLFFGLPFAVLQYRFNSLIYLPISIIAGCSISMMSASWRKRMKVFIPVIISVVIAFALYQIIYTPQYTGMSPRFHHELIWLLNNTPSNATFLNFNGDGTAIQYWTNRTTYSDTNFADNQTVIEDYYNFIYARAGNFSYLNQIKPEYLLIHQVPSINGDYNRLFNGSNIQYLLEWTRDKHPNFYYDGVLFNLVYANFSFTYINNGTIIYRLYYMNYSDISKMIKLRNNSS